MRIWVLASLISVILVTRIVDHGSPGLTSALHSRARSAAIQASVSVACTPISSTVVGCRLRGHGFASHEPIHLTYTLEIPVRPEITPTRPAPKLWGSEPPRVQCLTVK